MDFRIPQRLSGSSLCSPEKLFIVMYSLSWSIHLCVCGLHELGLFTDSGAWNKAGSACVLFLWHTLARWLMKRAARSCGGYWRAALGPQPRRRNGIKKGKQSVPPTHPPVNSRLHFTAAATSPCVVSCALSKWVSACLSCRCIYEKKKNSNSWSPSQRPV